LIVYSAVTEDTKWPMILENTGFNIYRTLPPRNLSRFINALEYTDNSPTVYPFQSVSLLPIPLPLKVYWHELCCLSPPTGASQETPVHLEFGSQ
jgi:hypothetical protein